MYPPINSICIMYCKNFYTVFVSWQFLYINWLRTSFLKQLLGKYTSPEPDPDLAVRILDPAKTSGFDWIPDPDPQHCRHTCSCITLPASGFRDRRHPKKFLNLSFNLHCPPKKLPATKKTPDFSIAFKAMIQKFLYFFLNIFYLPLCLFCKV